MVVFGKKFVENDDAILLDKNSGMWYNGNFGLGAACGPVTPSRFMGKPNFKPLCALRVKNFR